MRPTGVYVPDHLVARKLKEHLKLHMSERFPALTYGLTLPSGWAPKTAPPALVVFDDGGPDRFPVETRPQLRVVVWSDDLIEGRRVAAYALGQSLCRTVEGLASVLPGVSMMDARDENTGGIMVSYTVRARARTTLVAEA